jgi:hypothetical protein
MRRLKQIDASLGVLSGLRVEAAGQAPERRFPTDVTGRSEAGTERLRHTSQPTASIASAEAIQSVS